MFIRKLALGLVAFAMVATAAHAQSTVVEGNKNRTMTGNAMSGTYLPDSTARLLRTDENGYLQVTDADRDRDFPVMLNAFQSVVLNAGTTYQPISPIYVGQYSRLALMLTWSSAAADTDSVRIAVRVYGRKSLNSGNLYLWTPSSGITAADTCVTLGQVDADSSGVGRCLQPVSFIVAKPRHLGGFVVKGEMSNIYDGTFTTPANKSVRIRKIPGNAWRPYLGTGSVMLNLSDAAGNPCPFPYIFIEVSNLTKISNLTSVSCDIWPRVN
jgi:hypothetical protein